MGNLSTCWPNVLTIKAKVEKNNEGSSPLECAWCECGFSDHMLDLEHL